MKLTAGQIFDATLTLLNIMERGHISIPQTAKYRIAKMHGRLEPIFKSIEAKQRELVQIYGEEVFEDPETKTKPTGQWGIRPNTENHKKFTDEWNKVRAEEIEIPLLTPIPYESLGNEMRGLEAKDFALLGELVTEPKEA